MADIITQTTWHGNPRPIETYNTSVFIEQVSSPYYSDGRDVPVIKNVTTSTPITSVAAAIVVDIAGPATIVSFTVGGIWNNLRQAQIAVTVTDGTDYAETITNDSGSAVGPRVVATALAEAINAGSTDIVAGVDGETVTLTISPDSLATALTITLAAPV